MRSLLPAALLLAFTLPAPAAAQGVKRCTDARGNSVFTDRSCASLGAVAKGVPALAEGAYARGFAPRGCARRLDDLAMGVRTALEARDVNRLASYYHWPGTGSADSVMDALEEIAGRPLVAVALAYPAQPAPFDPLQEFGPNAAPEQDPSLPRDPGPQARSELTGNTAAAGDSAFTRDPAQATGPADAASPPDYPAQAADASGPAAPRPAGPRPIGLDVQQMAGDKDAGSRNTRFQLHRNAGCWWVSL